MSDRQLVRKLPVQLAGHGAALFPREMLAGWSKSVRAARALRGESERVERLTELAKQALGADRSGGYCLNVVQELPTGPVSPELYLADPWINFDPYLEQREYWPRAGRKGLLGPRTGYAFSVNGCGFAVLSERAVERQSPYLIRMHADHERFHARYHLRPTKSRADREVEAWLHGFVNYFHLIHGVRKRWKPLIDNFEQATPEAQERAIRALLGYYAASNHSVRDALLALLRRRRKDMPKFQLVKALSKRLLQAERRLSAR